MTEFLFLLLNVLVIVVSGVSFVMWVRLAPRIYRKGVRGFADEWLPATRRDCPTWGLAEVFVMFGSMIIFGQLLLQFASSNGWYEFPEPGASVTEQSPDMLFVVLGVSSLANCISIGLVLLWLWNIDRSNVNKIGLSFDRSMFVLGLKGIDDFATRVDGQRVGESVGCQYEHEVLNVLEKLDSPKVFAVFFGFVIVTPIAEELLFRGLIQGGLQRLANRFPANPVCRVRWRTCGGVLPGPLKTVARKLTRVLCLWAMKTLVLGNRFRIGRSWFPASSLQLCIWDRGQRRSHCLCSRWALGISIDRQAH